MKLWNLMLAHPVIVSIIAAVVGSLIASPKLSSAIKGMFSGLTNGKKPISDPGIVYWTPGDSQSTVVPGNLPTTDPLPTDDDVADMAAKTDAEQRVLMFSWLDRMRTYAIDEKNPKAVASANQLLNDLFTNEGDSHATVDTPSAGPSS